MTTVADLYASVLGRPTSQIDPEGLAYWTSMFGPDVSDTEADTFRSVAKVTEPSKFSNVAVSPTAAPAPSTTGDAARPTRLDTVGSYSSQFGPASGMPTSVSDFYQKFYGQSDPAGEAYWRQKFGTDNLTPTQAAMMVKEVGRLDPSINTGLTVDQAFRDYLGGNTDQAGMNYWKQQFGTGPLTASQLSQLTNAQYGLNDTGGGGLFGTGIGPDVSLSDAAKLAALYYGGSAALDALGAGTAAGVGAGTAAGVSGLGDAAAWDAATAGAYGGPAAGMTAADLAAAGAGVGAGAAAGAGAGSALSNLTGAGTNLGTALTAGALASGVGGILNANAARDAAATQAAAANTATQQQMDMFNKINAQQAPYRAAGYNALNQLGGLGSGSYQKYDANGNPIGIGTGSDYLTHQFNAADLKSGLAPNYDFMLQQGQMANQRAANAAGGGLGGNALTGLQRYTQDYAGNAYQNAFNNYQTQRNNIYNTLAGIAGIGQTGQNATNTAAQNATNAATQLGIGSAAAQAAGTVGSTSAYTGALNNAVNNYTLASLLNQGGRVTP